MSKIPSLFWAWNLISVLPVRISIAPPPAPPENCLVVARGQYYEIRHIEKNRYHVVVLAEYGHYDIPRYQTRYGFFLWQWLKNKIYGQPQNPI